MQNEFQAIEKEVAQLWWRVPLTLVIITTPFFLVSYALNRPEGHPLPPAQCYTPVVKPSTLSLLRLGHLACFFRLAWIYFAMETSKDYNLHWVEGCWWYLYFFCLSHIAIDIEVSSLRASRQP